MNQKTIAGSKSSTHPPIFTIHAGDLRLILGPGSAPTYSPNSSENQIQANGSKSAPQVINKPDSNLLGEEAEIAVITK